MTILMLAKMKTKQKNISKTVKINDDSSSSNSVSDSVLALSAQDEQNTRRTRPDLPYVDILQLKEHCVQQFVALMTSRGLTGLGVFHAAMMQRW